MGGCRAPLEADRAMAGLDNQQARQAEAQAQDEDDDNADVYVKTDSGKFVKSSDQKSDDDGCEKPQPSGAGLKPSDFERDFVTNDFAKITTSSQISM